MSSAQDFQAHVSFHMRNLTKKLSVQAYRIGIHVKYLLIIMLKEMYFKTIL